MTRAGSIPGVKGSVFSRGDDTYESLRVGALWNERKPQRFPEVIVVAATATDVVHAVRFARQRDLRVTTRSGGHNLSGACLRDGGMLIDLSRLQGISVDPVARTAAVQPALTSRSLAAALGDHGLAFPVGHCGSVPMGGYLLSGGLGWNMGQWGLACLAVQEIEVVTADGELVTANERDNSDLLWAARGAGSGFFGVVTRFTLSVQPMPGAIRSSTYMYPLADVEEVSAWACDIVGTLPASVEMMLHVVTAPPDMPAGPAGKAVAVAATAFESSDETAGRALAALETCPALSHALVRQTDQPSSFALLHNQLDQRLPSGHRYIEDALWSSADYAALIPRLAGHVVGAPSPKSMVMAVMPPPRADVAPMPHAAFSMIATTFVLCYAVWEDATEDERNAAWHRRLVGSIAPTVIGRYIGEASLGADGGAAERCFAPPSWQRLRALKHEFDPTNLFQDYLEHNGNKEEPQ